jgi:hypothetical protein
MSDSLPNSGAAIVEVVADRLDRGRDDRLVKRGQEHAQDEPGQDRQDLTMGQRAVRRRGRRTGCGGTHVVLPSSDSPVRAECRVAPVIKWMWVGS